jgi:hypothetical protein
MVLGAMPTDPRSNSPDDARWAESTTLILAGLGFSLVEPVPVQGVESGHLLVAIRPQPTLQHFDPETIDYWVNDGVHGRPAKLERESRLPLATDYSWGQIGLTDRLGVENQFLSFGGTMRAQMTADGSVVADFSSNAPILRWSGHSQITDPVASEVGAFFARIKVPIDFVPGAEALVSKAGPRTLYCAFIQTVRERLTQAQALREANRWLAEWSSRESQRMETTFADSWKAASDMRRQLSAIEAIARE